MVPDSRRELSGENATVRIPAEESSNVRSSRPVVVSHHFIVLAAEIARLLSLEIATVMPGSCWVHNNWPVAASHNFIVLSSRVPDTARALSGDSATDVTRVECAWKACNDRLFVVSHNISFPSSVPQSKRSPLRANAAELTRSEVTAVVFKSAPVDASHSLIVLSWPAESTCAPSLDNVTANTEPE